MPISSHELKHFLNYALIETGSGALGHGIQSALTAGFKKVYSVDINPQSVQECKALFKNDNRVQIDCADCEYWLQEILCQVSVPCTIYLDANGAADETEHPFDSSVRAIARNGHKHHIILVDDMNHGKVSWEELVNELRLPTSRYIPQLRKINPDYVFYLIDTHLEDLSHVFPSWVLVADPIKDRFPKMNPEDFI